MNGPKQTSRGGFKRGGVNRLWALPAPAPPLGPRLLFPPPAGSRRILVSLITSDKYTWFSASSSLTRVALHVERRTKFETTTFETVF